MSWHSLESGMRRTLLKILVTTVAATLVTYLIAVVAFLVLQDRYIQPANYSELQVENVQNLVEEKGAALLNASAAPLLDAAMGDSMLTYQVVNAEGQTLYGTYQPEGVVLNRQVLLNAINTAHSEGDGYVHTVPIFDETGTLVGAIRCAYDFQVRFERTEAIARLTTVFFVLALISPVLWLLLFSWLFSRRFAAQIRTPLALLRQAAQKISERDLDFTIDYYADNELGDLLTAFEDMRRNLGASLAQQWRLAEQRRNMVAALAHDLKTPLSVIKAYSESLEDDTPVNDEQRAYLRVIGDNVDRSASLIRRLQDVSLLESEETRVARTPCDLRAFLQMRVQEYRVQAGQQNVSVMLDIGDSLAACYALDTEKIRRILDNLVGNSLAVTAAGGHVMLAAWEENDRLMLEVRDDGTGFTAKDLKHATEEFYRGDEARSTRGGHAGLGLFIVRTLAEQLGGGVALSNNAEGGACVRVWQPALSVDEESSIMKENTLERTSNDE